MEHMGFISCIIFDKALMAWHMPYIGYYNKVIIWSSHSRKKITQIEHKYAFWWRCYYLYDHKVR